MARELIAFENDVELWEITHPTGDAVAYSLKDPRRTPETWSFGNKQEAWNAYRARLTYAADHPPVR